MAFEAGTSTKATAAGGRRRRGRILAVKWGLNPNSSSLGVDVTFLLFGAAAVSLATPVIAALLRLRRPGRDVDPGMAGTPGTADTAGTK
jgi:hypothetical protein